MAARSRCTRVHARRDAAGRAGRRRRRRADARPRARAGAGVRHVAALGALVGADARARGQAAVRRRRWPRWSPSRSTSSTTRTRPRSPSSTAPSRRPRWSRGRRPSRWSTRCCAATCASATTLNAAVAAASPVARWSYPRWWIGRVRGRSPAALAGDPRGRQRAAAADVAREPPRDDARRAGGREFAARTSPRRPVGAAGLIVTPPRPVTELPGYAEGEFSVQDAGAQLAAPLLDVRDGMRVLDACAAPGGKTTHLARARGRRSDGASSSDAARHRARARRIWRACTCGRVGAATGRRRRRRSGGLVGRPAVRPHPRRRPVHGVRRRPAASGRQVAAAQESDIACFAAQQRRILDGLWPLLAPGGRACCTRPARCSRPKTSCRSTTFSSTHPDALRETISFPPDCPHAGGQLLPSGKAAGHNQDGFFYALLRKG